MADLYNKYIRYKNFERENAHEQHIQKGGGEEAEKLGSKKCTRGQCTGEYQKRGAIEFFVTKS